MLSHTDHAAMHKQLQRDNSRQGEKLAEVPQGEWPDSLRIAKVRPFRVWRSRKFLVQEFAELDGVIRLSVNRTAIQRDGRWVDGITWDHLQALKAEAGYGKRDAVEVFPPDYDLVDVANMRHLWVLPYKLPFAWRK